MEEQQQTTCCEHLRLGTIVEGSALVGHDGWMDLYGGVIGKEEGDSSEEACAVGWTLRKQVVSPEISGG